MRRRKGSVRRTDSDRLLVDRMMQVWQAENPCAVSGVGRWGYAGRRVVLRRFLARCANDFPLGVVAFSGRPWVSAFDVDVGRLLMRANDRKETSGWQ